MCRSDGGNIVTLESRWLLALITAIAMALSSCDRDDPGVEQTAGSSSGPPKTAERPLLPGSFNANWLTHGRTYGEQRFSPLEQVNADNVRGLGLDWFFDIPTDRGLEARPLVLDGVMYVAGSWSTVFALDARTGEQIWDYEPAVARI